MDTYNPDINKALPVIRSPVILEKVRRLIFYIYCPFQIAIQCARFIAEVKEWMGSGRSSRFKPCVGDRVVDKKTGRTWPISFFRSIEREDFGD
jgi:hypothetical protein